MEFQERESGLVVPKEKPAPPKRRYGPLEIADEDRRALAREALCKLWDAMNLSNPCGGIRLPGTENYDTYESVYRFVGTGPSGAPRANSTVFPGVRDFLVDIAGLCALASKHSKTERVSGPTKQAQPSEITSPPQNYARCRSRGCNKPARVRGYCLSCYRSIARLVRLGRSTWDEH